MPMPNELISHYFDTAYQLKSFLTYQVSCMYMQEICPHTSTQKHEILFKNYFSSLNHVISFCHAKDAQYDHKILNNILESACEMNTILGQYDDLLENLHNNYLCLNNNQDTEKFYSHLGY